jgi:hypothetical protein
MLCILSFFVYVLINTFLYTFSDYLLYCNFLSHEIWAQMALASLVPFQGPKMSRFSGPPPLPMPLVMMLHSSKPLLYVPRHKNNRYINSYYVCFKSSTHTGLDCIKKLGDQYLMLSKNLVFFMEHFFCFRL